MPATLLWKLKEVVQSSAHLVRDAASQHCIRNGSVHTRPDRAFGHDSILSVFEEFRLLPLSVPWCIGADHDAARPGAEMSVHAAVVLVSVATPNACACRPISSHLLSGLEPR
eukprot:scaffold7207_cov520-Prasinococcus_capsulatus_cf.AAC.12